MTKDELKQLLASRDNDEFIDAELLNRRPWIFGADAEHNSWCTSVADVLEIEKDHIHIVGSAATGFSLSPLKPGRPFRKLGSHARASDIDLAITSKELFEEAWNTIVSLDRRLSLGIAKEEREKMRTDVYWGLVAQRSLPANTVSARRLLTAVSVATKTPPIRGHVIRCRVYRRKDDLKAYHVSSLRQLRAELDV
jgi:hypothetical protein